MPANPKNPNPSERWFLTCLLSLVPILLAIVLPEGFRIPLFVLAGVLIIWGLVQMSRQPPTDLRGE